MTPVIKLLHADQWRAFQQSGEFAGSPDDVRDGFIHLSTPEQMPETAARYFAGAPGVIAVTLDADALGAALRWEPSRGGALFPHLYRALTLHDVVTAMPLAPGATLPA